MNYSLTMKSGNAKVGPIPVSTSTRATCPTSCAFYGNGCYADAGPLALHWRKVTEGARGASWGAFLAEVRTIAPGALWRHNQAGDLPGAGDKIDAKALRELVKAQQGRRGFTYTHKPMTVANAKAVEAANKAGFTINLSGNNLAQADTLADLNIAPVVVVLPGGHGERGADIFTPAGRRVVVCPATYREEINCASCQLCQRANREVIVGFPAHGTGARKAATVARGA